MQGELWVSSNIENTNQSSTKHSLLNELELNIHDVAPESIPILGVSDSDTINTTDSEGKIKNENKAAQDLFQKILGKNKSKKQSTS